MKALQMVLALVITMLATGSAKAEYRWTHFGTAPYATSREAAMRIREDAFRAMSLPAPVITQFMRLTEQSGDALRLTNGTRLNAMLSKGGVVHTDVVVAFVKPPISGKMEYAAPAEKWEVELEGQTFVLVLPAICNNWSIVVKKPRCVELPFNAPIGGKARWGVGSVNGPLPPSDCNAQKQGDGPWTAWTGECDDCVPPTEYLGSIFGASVTIPHKYLYAVTETEQTLRFSTAVWADVVYICLDANGRQTCGVYTRPQDWEGRYRVPIEDGLWVWSETGCP